MSKLVPPDAHWRDSARTARFFMVDSRAAFPLLLFILHWRLWTFCLAAFCITIFAALERYGFTVPVFKRALISWLGGPRKMSAPWWK